MNSQGSEEWRYDRAGKITASMFYEVTTKSKRDGKHLAARKKYMQQLAFERTSGVPMHEISARSLSWGKDLEAYACEAYELETGNATTEYGFVTHPEFDFIGCSVDRLVGVDGGLEIKAPHDETVHLMTWMDGIPEDHIPQVQGCMFVTKRKWWDFVSYDPRQHEKLRLYVQRIERDDKYINEVLEPELMAFNNELESLIARIMEKAD